MWWLHAQLVFVHHETSTSGLFLPEEPVDVEDDSEGVAEQEEDDDDQEHDGLPPLLGLLGRRRRTPWTIRHSSSASNHLKMGDLLFMFPGTIELWGLLTSQTVWNRRRL